MYNCLGREIRLASGLQNKRLCSNNCFKMVCQISVETYLRIAKLLEVEVQELIKE